VKDFDFKNVPGALPGIPVTFGAVQRKPALTDTERRAVKTEFSKDRRD
jgi:hypothetical protein